MLQSVGVLGVLHKNGYATERGGMGGVAQKWLCYERPNAGGDYELVSVPGKCYATKCGDMGGRVDRRLSSRWR